MHASSEEEARTTGMIPTASIFFRTSSLLILFVRLRDCTCPGSSAGDASAFSFHHLQDLLQRNHRSVARSGHSERPMRSAAIHGPLWVFAGEKPINQSRGKGIAASHS